MTPDADDIIDSLRRSTSAILGGGFLIGSHLTATDLEKLTARWIDPEMAERAGLRRVDRIEGAELVGRNPSRGDYSGIAIPYFLPGETRPREHRLRVDHPAFEDGKEQRKYLGPPGRSSMLYFPPGVTPELLARTDLPLIVVEGEFKCLALWKLANYDTDVPRFVPIGIAGVWNWRGTIGKTIGPDGDRRDETGLLPDWSHITLKGRRVYIAFDADIAEKEQVRWARNALAKVLRSRGAAAAYLEWDKAAGKGVDDHLNHVGPQKVLEEIRAVRFVTGGAPYLLRQLFTDSGNGERFVAMHHEDARYCHAMKKWLLYDGRRWKSDEGEKIRLLAKAVMAEFLRQALEKEDKKAAAFAITSHFTKGLSNMLREAQAALAISPDELDQHPDLLVFENGTVDLTSGELGPHCAEHYITKMVHYDYNPEAKCPLFMSTLLRMMGGGPDASEGALERAEQMVDAMQRNVGYTFTGRTSEKKVFFLYGGTNTGKTTFLSLMLNLLKEHGTLLQIESLMSKQETSNSQADLADLRGARFAMTSEAEEGQRLSEGKLKRITQGMSKIKGVRKYENPLEFPETHKLWFDANHKPLIHGTDDSIWGRLYVILFTNRISDEEIKEHGKKLPEKLLAEAEGILAWGVAGAVLWYASGLIKPEGVLAAGAAYRHEMDQIRRFIDDSCFRNSGNFVGASAIYEAYQNWTESGREKCITRNSFWSKLLEQEGVTKEHKEEGNFYFGIGLRTTLREEMTGS